MRGVNKLVMEVRPEDGYFEKAILFIRTEKQSAPQKEISEGAEKLLYDISNKKFTKTRYIRLIYLLSGIAAGSAISWILVYFISAA